MTAFLESLLAPGRGGAGNPGGVDFIEFDVNVKQDPEGWGNLITSPSGKHYPVKSLKSKLNTLYDSLPVKHVRERLQTHTYHITGDTTKYHVTQQQPDNREFIK